MKFVRKNSIILILLVFIFIFFINKLGTDIEKEWNENPNNRNRIIDKIIKKYDFYSMKKDEVIELLGNPDKPIAAAVFDPEVDFSDPNSLFYFTSKGSIPEEHRGFYIRFNEDGYVYFYSKVQFST